MLKMHFLVFCLTSLTDSVFSAGHRDEFYLAPEYQEHGIVTEKVCLAELLPFVLQLTSTYQSVFSPIDILFCLGSGLCLWGCCYSLGHSQVQFIT